MRPFLILVAGFLAACNFQGNHPSSEEKTETSEKMTTYFFIRHAEKDLTNPEEKDPELPTKVGKER